MPKPSSLPDFLYGTAWKEDRTAALTELALRAGFRGIDTANQRRHYFEAGVGEGLASELGDRLEGFAGLLRVAPELRRRALDRKSVV